MKKIGSVCLALVIALTVIMPYKVFAASKGVAPIEKEDEVLITTDASGNILDKKASVVITGADSSNPIKDKTILSDIKNISGDESFSQEEDGTIIWDNTGNDINYLGTLNADLPFSMKVTYYLDDCEVAPEEIAGKTGHVKVLYSFENLKMVDVEMDGEKYSTYVPLLTVTTINLPMDRFENVESLDGGLIVEEFGDNYFMLGVAAPGTNESLNLGLLGMDQYFTFPESFGFTADVTSFEMPSTVTCVTPHVLDKLDLSSLDTTNGIEEKINELVTATEQLVDGSSQLAGGSSQLSNGITEFVRAFQAGLQQISDGSTQLGNELYDLETKKNVLKEQAGELITQLDAMLVQLNSLVLPSPDSIFTPELTEAQAKLKEDATSLIAALETMRSQLEEIQAFAVEAQAYIDQMNEIGNIVYSELSAIDLDQLIADATELAKQQAIQAAREEFSGMMIPEEQLNTIINNIMSKIDISSVADEARVHIERVKEVLSNIPQLEIPEFKVDIDPVIAILQDMQSQFTVLETASSKQQEIVELLNSAHAFMNSAKENSVMLRKKSNDLISGLDFADGAIQSAHEYINTLKNAVNEASQGSAQIVNGANEVSGGAQRLAEGTKQYYSEGILTAADYAREATLKAFLNRSKAHILASSKYTNLTGIEETTRGSIRFTIQTSGIKASAE